MAGHSGMACTSFEFVGTRAPSVKRRVALQEDFLKPSCSASFSRSMETGLSCFSAATTRAMIPQPAGKIARFDALESVSARSSWREHEKRLPLGVDETSVDVALDEIAMMGYNTSDATHRGADMSSNFKDFVDSIEQDASPEERRELEENRRRYRVGAKLLDRRLAAGLSQRELAQASGIDQAEISRIERGQGNPTVETLLALGTPLGITLDFTSILA
jgi:ribosome-binding protein aMBF1 (putative translation factor)